MVKPLILVTAALLAVSGPVERPGSDHIPSIVGTWLLESIVDTLTDGTLYFWMGPHPTGAIMYDATGHMSVQVLRDPRPTFSASAAAATPVELRAAYDGYYAYFGRYALNAAGDSVTHFVQTSHRPEEVGITYHRRVKGYTRPPVHRRQDRAGRRAPTSSAHLDASTLNCCDAA